jgi:hypothetical protein
VLTALIATEGLATVWLRSDVKSVAAETGKPKAITARVNNLIAHLTKQGLISRTETHITILDYEGLRKELERGRPKPKGGEQS